MFGFLKKIAKLRYLKLKYLLQGSIVIVKGKLVGGKNVKIKRSLIVVPVNCTMKLGEAVVFSCVKWHVTGDVDVGSYSIIEQAGSSEPLSIKGKGRIVIGEHSRVRARIWIRFGGTITIGDYTNINEFSEVRCDERVEIGDFNQISYNVMIWDTNTHNMYPASKRREITIEKYPKYGFEYEKPSTKPVFIGDDCWISKNVTLLKGTVLNSRCVVGYGCLISNQVIEENLTVYNNLQLRTRANNL